MRLLASQYIDFAMYFKILVRLKSHSKLPESLDLASDMDRIRLQDRTDTLNRLLRAGYKIQQGYQEHHSTEPL